MDPKRAFELFRNYSAECTKASGVDGPHELFIDSMDSVSCSICGLRAGLSEILSLEAALNKPKGAWVDEGLSTFGDGVAEFEEALKGTKGNLITPMIKSLEEIIGKQTMTKYLGNLSKPTTRVLKMPTPDTHKNCSICKDIADDIALKEKLRAEAPEASPLEKLVFDFLFGNCCSSDSGEHNLKRRPDYELFECSGCFEDMGFSHMVEKMKYLPSFVTVAKEFLNATTEHDVRGAPIKKIHLDEASNRYGVLKAPYKYQSIEPGCSDTSEPKKGEWTGALKEGFSPALQAVFSDYSKPILSEASNTCTCPTLLNGHHDGCPDKRD